MRIPRILLWMMIGASLPGGALLAHAAPASCAFNAELGMLDALMKKDSPDSLETLREELTLRKIILLKAADCGTEEVGALRRGMETATAGANADVLRLRESLAARLTQTIEYYDLVRSRTGTLGIHGTKEMARDLREWRASSYRPLADTVTNFIIWAKNQPLLRVAENRLSQVDQTIQSLKLSEYEEVKNFWRDAGRNLAEAKRANEEARGSLARFDSPEESLARIEYSLRALSLTYQNFFDLGETAKRILPR